MIAIGLSKQQALDAYPRAIQQINFTANLDRTGNTTMFLIIEEARETISIFTKKCKRFVSIIWFIEFNSCQYKNDTIQ